MKKCPNCAEESVDKAILCQHCGEIIYSVKASQAGNKVVIYQVILFVLIICGLLFFLYQSKRQAYLQPRPGQTKLPAQQEAGLTPIKAQPDLQETMQEQVKLHQQLAVVEQLQGQANALQAYFNDLQQSFQQKQQQKQQKELLGQNCRTTCNPDLMYSDGKTMGMNCYTECE